jgi:toxin ParE1/3/4
MKVVVSQKADSDLLRIFSHLCERNPLAAENLIGAVDQKLEQLSRFPFIGRERATLLSGLRSVIVGNYLIFYLVRAEDIAIVRVIDGRMDIDEEFQR